MNERLDHPTMERLNGFVEDSLEEAAHAAVEAHLTVCTECRTEVAELRSVFHELSTLAAFAPAADFADRVMTNVKVRRPAFAGATAWAGEWLDRLAPRTTRGWATATAILALPVIGATILFSWLLAQPGVTPQGLWTFVSELAVDGLSNGLQWAWGQFAGTTVAAWLARGLEVVGTVGHGELGLAAVLFATLTAGSVYVLYQNLFRPIARRTEHASYVF